MFVDNYCMRFFWYLERRGYQTLIILDITKTEFNDFFYYTLSEKNGSHDFASWVLHWRQATQSGRTWHDYPWPWMSLTCLLRNLLLYIVREPIKPNLMIFFIIIIHNAKKNGSCVFAPSLTASNTKQANLTWFPVTLNVLDMIIEYLISYYILCGNQSKKADHEYKKSFKTCLISMQGANVIPSSLFM